MITILTIIFVTLLSSSHVLAKTDDGTARTPPMGFLSYTAFDTDTDCDRYPNSCINEQLYKEMADRLVADGFADLGYRYVNVDDRWMEKDRDANRRLVADRKRFPSGIKGLADYMHSKGLLLGIYGDIGNLTCSGTLPGQNNHNTGERDFFDIDAQTFAEWGVDSFKQDGCYEDVKKYDQLYPRMGDELNKTGRHILFTCEWPFFQYVLGGIHPDYAAISRTCHTYRNYKDVLDSWASIDEIIKYYGDYNDEFIKYSGPGHFADPDELTIGNSGLSYDQSRTQMAMWSVWSSPLLISTDLRKLRPEYKAILQNRELIAVNQDRHGIMAKMVYRDNDHQIWVKPMEPVIGGQWSYAVVYLHKRPMGHPIYMSKTVSELIPDVKDNTKYEVHDLFLDDGKEILGTVGKNDRLELLVRPSGSVRMVKLVVK
ncbi:alpha-N-acetylgalactosaminidase-like [Oppia nitens]|uniref:alpha-N-acetylgalactosaminidase-like n=1 Tax=Oppia nitens TaxID=1686743 RepID=UPI0023DC197C|nr:alpha-N-acetylgalactosaminidase-like [Oppia nitens]